MTLHHDGEVSLESEGVAATALCAPVLRCPNEHIAGELVAAARWAEGVQEYIALVKEATK